MGYSGNQVAKYLGSRASSVEWARENVTLGRFSSQLADNLGVLDVPFGTGRALPIYASKSWRVTGVDVSTDMLVHSRRLNGGVYPFEVAKAPATHLPFPDKHFDVVVSLRFLASVVSYEDAVASLDEMLRVCKGHAILEVAFASERGFDAQGKFMRKCLREEQFDLLLSRRGFKVSDILPIRQDAESSDWIVLAERSSGRV